MEDISTEGLKAVQLPQTVRLFPLPNHVLLPDLPVTFRVFEPRYKKLVTDLLELEARDRWIAIPRLAPHSEEDSFDSPAFWAVATVARVIRIEKDDAEDFQIVVRGVDRVRLVEEPSDYAYRIARVERWADVSIEKIREISDGLNTLLQLVTSLASYLDDEVLEILQRVENAPDISTMVYRFASIFLSDPDWRQQLLETRRLDQRINLLEQVLAAALALALQTRKNDTPPS